MIGPLARSADDLKLVTKILCGKNGENLDFEPNPQQIKVFYMLELQSRWFLSRPDKCIKEKLKDITDYLQTKQINVEQFDTKEFYYLPEACNMALNYSCKFPHFLTKPKQKKNDNDMEKADDSHASFVPEFWKSVFGCSNYTFGLIWFEMVCQRKGFVLPWTVKKWMREMERLKALFIVSSFIHFFE